MSSREQRIIQALTATLQPATLVVRDISHTHHGHAAAGEETHFTITIASPVFKGLTRVAQHRLVNNALADEFATGLHAVAINIGDNS